MERFIDQMLDKEGELVSKEEISRKHDLITEYVTEKRGVEGVSELVELIEDDKYSKVKNDLYGILVRLSASQEYQSVITSTLSRLPSGKKTTIARRLIDNICLHKTCQSFIPDLADLVDVEGVTESYYRVGSSKPVPESLPEEAHELVRSWRGAEFSEEQLPEKVRESSLTPPQKIELINYILHEYGPAVDPTSLSYEELTQYFQENPVFLAHQIDEGLLENRLKTGCVVGTRKAHHFGGPSITSIQLAQERKGVPYDDIVKNAHKEPGVHFGFNKLWWEASHPRPTFIVHPEIMFSRFGHKTGAETADAPFESLIEGVDDLKKRGWEDRDISFYNDSSSKRYRDDVIDSRYLLLLLPKDLYEKKYRGIIKGLRDQGTPVPHVFPFEGEDHITGMKQFLDSLGISYESEGQEFYNLDTDWDAMKANVTNLLARDKENFLKMETGRIRDSTAWIRRNVEKYDRIARELRDIKEQEIKSMESTQITT